MEVNSVDSLLKKQFSLLTLKEKLDVKRLGRPTPFITLTQECKSHSKKIMRKFNSSIYEKYDWLCGCSIRKAVFCFPCILFGGETLWTTKGMADLNHMHFRASKHCKSSMHLNNTLNLAVLGKYDICSLLDSSYRRSIQEHNNKVSHNRHILKLLINCILFCGSFELALRGHDESDGSLNSGVFKGLINFTADLNNELKTHLEKATVFKGTSKSTQNEILSAMLSVYHTEISKEIKNADHIAIMADETSDVANIFQMVIVYRYIVNNRPVERFWKFISPTQHSALSLASVLKEDLLVHIGDAPEKLISQSYDGASVMSGSSGGVQAILKKDFINAHFIHCHAHQLNLIISQAASINRQVRIFFSDLSGFSTFFSHSPQRTAVLDKIVGHRLPRTIKTRWNFNSRVVNSVFEYKDALISCMKEIETSEEIKNQETLRQASGLRRTLQDPHFLYWLSFFHQIMPHVEILYNQLQKRESDPMSIHLAINLFEKSMQKLRLNIEDIDMTPYEPISKRRRIDPQQGSAERERSAIEVLDTILYSTKERFKYSNHLSISKLFLPTSFMEYNSKFPAKHFDDCIKHYTTIDSPRLKTELMVLYSRSEFYNISGSVHLLEFLTENNLNSCFTEVIKLLKILLTIPMTTSEPERCFSTLKRVKTFLRNTMCEDRLTALSMLSIEKKFIRDMPGFMDKVVDNYASSKSRRADFIYK